MLQLIAVEIIFGVWSGGTGTKRNHMGIVFLVMYRFYQANRLQVKVKNE